MCTESSRTREWVFSLSRSLREGNRRETVARTTYIKSHPPIHLSLQREGDERNKSKRTDHYYYYRHIHNVALKTAGLICIYFSPTATRVVPRVCCASLLRNFPIKWATRGRCARARAPDNVVPPICGRVCTLWIRLLLYGTTCIYTHIYYIHRHGERASRGYKHVFWNNGQKFAATYL